MPTLDGLIVERDPPPKRRGKSGGGREQDLTEAAVMLAFAMDLFDKIPGVQHVEIHPDGEHGKRFDIRGWLERQGFRMDRQLGRTHYGGVYLRGGLTLTVAPTSGLGDVVAHAEGQTIVAECKGGIVNTKHAGQRSHLRQRLCEAVGLLMTRPARGERHVRRTAYPRYL